MEINVKCVSASEDGDYFQISFDNDDSRDDGLDYGSPGAYLIVQRQFEDGDDGICYVETHDHDYCGHLRLRLISFSETRFAMEILDRPARTVSVGYKLSKENFEDVGRVVKVIFGTQAREG